MKKGEGFKQFYDHWCEMLWLTCEKFDLYPGEVMHTKYKVKNVAKARAFLGQKMYDTVRWRHTTIYPHNNSRIGGVRTTEYIIVPEGDNIVTEGWSPCSYPMMAKAITGGNHATFVISLKKLAKDG